MLHTLLLLLAAAPAAAVGAVDVGAVDVGAVDVVGAVDAGAPPPLLLDPAEDAATDVAADPVDVDRPPPALTASMRARNAAVVQKSHVKDAVIAPDVVDNGGAVVLASACAGGVSICALPLGVPGVVIALALPGAVSGGAAVLGGKGPGTALGVAVGAGVGTGLGAIVLGVAGAAVGAASTGAAGGEALGGIVMGGVVGAVAGGAAGAAGGAAIALAFE